MKTWNWAFAVNPQPNHVVVSHQRCAVPLLIAAIAVAGFVFTGCDDGSTPETAVTNVMLDQTELGLLVGEEETLIATVLPESAAVKTITWSSSKTVTATVDENGKVTARSLGEVIITATAKNGKKAICVVTVGDVAVSGVSLQPALALEIGEKSRLIADVQPPDAANKNVNWSSDDDEVATVNFDGTVTAIGVGEAIITATARSGGLTGTCTVTVSNISVTDVTLNKTTLRLEAGDDETLSATVLPAKAFDKTVIWSSDDDNVATVDENGKVTAVTNGEATITVTTNDGGIEDTCAVIVERIPIVSVTLVGELYLSVGGKKILIPMISPEYINPKNITISWVSSSPGVATVSNGTVTGVAASDDDVTITVTVSSLKDPANIKTDTCTVSVGVGMIQYMPLISGGTFQMGSPLSEPEREDDETRHEVTLNSFYMLDTLVPLVDYSAVMGDLSTSWFYYDYRDEFGDDWGLCPMEGVSWYDAVEFCNKLSEIEGFTPAYTITDRRPATGLPITKATVTIDWDANGYRLPTEAEWEYACRAGTATPFYTGNNILAPDVERDEWDDIIAVHDWGEANYYGEYPYNDNEPGGYFGMPALPYLYEPNDKGIIAMHGNLEEWCWDWYGDYDTTPQTNPRGPNSGTYRIARGGSYQDAGTYLRSASRWAYLPDEDYNGFVGVPWIGFRIVRNAPSEPDTRAVIGRSGTAKRALKILPQGMPQGKRTFVGMRGVRSTPRQIPYQNNNPWVVDKNSAPSVKSPAFRKRGAEE
jgi:uncharacterized protein YjdB